MTQHEDSYEKQKKCPEHNLGSNHFQKFSFCGEKKLKAKWIFKFSDWPLWWKIQPTNLCISHRKHIRELPEILEIGRIYGSGFCYAWAEPKSTALVKKNIINKVLTTYFANFTVNGFWELSINDVILLSDERLLNVQTSHSYTSAWLVIFIKFYLSIVTQSSWRHSWTFVPEQLSSSSYSSSSISPPKTQRNPKALNHKMDLISLRKEK